MEDFNRFIRPCWRVDGFTLLEFVIFAPGKTSSWLRTLLQLHLLHLQGIRVEMDLIRKGIKTR